MEIPKTIKVGNVTYSVEIKKLRYNLGKHHKKKGARIIIAEGLAEDVLINVFFHELVHAILFQIGSPENTNELFVQSLTNELDKLFELKSK